MLKMKPSLNVGRLVSDLATIGDNVTDTEQVKVQHHLLVYMGLLMGFGGLLWGSISTYFQLFLPASIPFGYSILTIINFVLFYATKNFQRARFAQVLLSLVLPFLFQWSLGGFVSSGAMMLWAILALVGSMTFYEIKWGIRWLGMYLLLTIFSGFIDGYVTAAFGLNLPPSTTTLFFVLNIAIISSFVFGLGLYLLNLLRFSEANLENLVVERTNQLNNLLGSLEQRVADRTRDLEIVAEVGTATATIQESKRLLQEVVDLTKERFNLYHSHIYLLDDERKNLVLTAGAGEPGRVMAAEGHSIPLDREQSLVARTARERKGVTVNDVTQAPDFLPNPLLPNTRSELAVPMIVGGKVIGVFDIQSDQIGRFTDADVNIQTTLAAQLAASIQNVLSFEQSRKQAELESLVNVIGQRIQRTTSIEETLQTAIRELGTAIGASRVKANLAPTRQGDGNTASRN